MLTEIRLRNFKGFRELNLKPKQVTVLIGPNGSGKSSCMQALLLLKQSIGQRSLVASGEHMRLGEFADIVHRGMRGPGAKALSIGVSGAIPLAQLADEFGEGNLRYTYSTECTAERLTRQECEITSKIVELQYVFSGGESKGTPSKFQLGNIMHGLSAGDHIGQPVRVVSSNPIGSASSQEVSESGRLAGRLLNVFSEVLRNIYLVPAIRGFDADFYSLGDSSLIDFGAGVQPEVRAQHLVTTLAYRREFEQVLSEWFMRITGVAVEFKVVEQKRVSVDAGTGRRRHKIVNEGFGSNQLTFALAQLAISPEHSVICYEEPETHLHPRAQSELTNILVEVAKQETKQVILTTHSEHILYGFLANIAEGKLLPSELSIWYFNRENGEVQKPQRLRVDKKGRVAGGLRGFFEVELEEMERYFKALQKHE